MIWPIQQEFLVIALVFTLVSFYQRIEPLGRVFFMLFSGITWMSYAIGLFEITFHSGGSTAMVFWDYSLGGSSTPTGIVYLFGLFGLMMFIMGIVRAIQLTYQPVIDGTITAMGERKTPGFHDI